MCGISCILGDAWRREQLSAMVASQRHRGPDDEGLYVDPSGIAGLGHNRLSIIDLADAGRQPMQNMTGRYRIVFNGEIYNYLELREELASEYFFRTGTDTEVLLAAYIKWGEACLDKLIGMFAFLIWDEKEKRLFGARDRFGVKPLYYCRQDGTLFMASEIKGLHAAGLKKTPNAIVWATYLTYGLHDHSEDTFWEGIKSVLPGHKLQWQDSRLIIGQWYDLAGRTLQTFDNRPEEVVIEEYTGLLRESVRLRFRSDVPAGINLSGGLDSSTLLGIVQKAQGEGSDVKAFTFVTGDPDYDELPWVRQMLASTMHPLVVCPLTPDDVPGLAESVQLCQDEPFGGLPTIAYARLFEQARENGVIVLLDGQGMDEQWAGYDYYQSALNSDEAPIVQGSKDGPVRPDCLLPEFRVLAVPQERRHSFPDLLRSLQYRDAVYTKLPRALRFNDRISMRVSTELREPFLDHRLFELAFRQPQERKIVRGENKFLLRKITEKLLPAGVVRAKKRPLQTPQREWLRGPLSGWVEDEIERGITCMGNGWLDTGAVRKTWQRYKNGEGDNSFFIWQWISLGLLSSGNRT